MATPPTHFSRLRRFITRLISRISILPLRVFAFVLHTTGLERIYKPHFSRHVAVMEINDEFIAQLPSYCRTMSGAESDPINLVFIGTERELRRSFRLAGWHRAHPASPFHIMAGFISAVFKRSYQSGPFAPLYINIGLQDMTFQQTSGRRGFRERHHLRLWRTGFYLSNGHKVWVAAAGHEDGMRLSLAMPFWTHALDPDLDHERQYIVDSLEDQGAVLIKHIKLTPRVLRSRPKRSIFGSFYYTDGRAAVVEVRHGA